MGVGGNARQEKEGCLIREPVFTLMLNFHETAGGEVWPFSSNTFDFFLCAHRVVPVTRCICSLHAPGKEAIVLEVTVTCWQKRLEQTNVAPWMAAMRSIKSWPGLFRTVRSTISTRLREAASWEEVRCKRADPKGSRHSSFVCVCVWFIYICPHCEEYFMQFTMVHNIKTKHPEYEWEAG